MENNVYYLRGDNVALLLNKYINSCGVEVENGYFELTEVSYNSTIKALTFSGDIWMSKEIKDEGFNPVDHFEEGFELHNLPDKNIFDVVYDYIIDLSKNDLEYLEENFPKYIGFIGCEEIK